MDGWMDGWMMDGWMDRGIHRWMRGVIGGMDTLMDGRIDSWMDGRVQMIKYDYNNIFNFSD